MVLFLFIFLDSFLFLVCLIFMKPEMLINIDFSKWTTLPIFYWSQQSLKWLFPPTNPPKTIITSVPLQTGFVFWRLKNFCKLFKILFKRLLYIFFIYLFIRAQTWQILHVCLMMICGKVLCIGLLSLMSNIRIYVQQQIRRRSNIFRTKNNSN